MCGHFNSFPADFDRTIDHQTGSFLVCQSFLEQVVLRWFNMSDPAHADVITMEDGSQVRLDHMQLIFKARDVIIVVFFKCH